MHHKLGIYLIIAGILMGFYLLFHVYLPNVIVSSELQNPTVSPENMAQPVQLIKYAEAEENDEDLIAALEKKNDKKHVASIFTAPDGLKIEVDFWKDIYAKYTSDQAVIHDINDLGKTYGVISLPHCSDPPTAECLDRRNDVIKAEKEAVCDKLGYKSDDRKVVRKTPKKNKCKEKAYCNIRAQVGQRDKFIVGIKDSKKIMKDVERIFGGYGIPKELSRLPFVESMFNLEARSRIGASGIWQFMPATARMFGLKVNRALDERNDPIKATDAAARHLLRDYKRLGKWDLAINAYNCGPGRLVDAIAKLGTDDIVAIIRNYANLTYGFASRNFYPEFLAALDVYENRFEYFRGDLNVKKQ